MIEELFPERVEVQAVFRNVKDLVEHLYAHEAPDILFLDIMVADGNSFDLFDHMTVTSNVIFTTAYDEYAVKAFRKNAIDYLMKPIKKEELVSAVDRLKMVDDEQLVELRKTINPFKERFLIRFANKLHSVRTEDVAYIYSEEKLSFFVEKDGKRVASDIPLKDIQNDLDPTVFFRVNRQFIVHIDAVSEITRISRSRLKVTLLPASPQDVVVSTDMTPRFKEWMDR
jgi:DNA-binding LytR/AlgR family response regulator